MIQLTANVSDALIELMRDDEPPIDGVEVGPWFSVRQILKYRRTLPELPFYFHGSNLIERVGLIPGTIPRIRAYLLTTGSSWLSMHITMWLPGMAWLMLQHGWRLPLPSPERATRRLIRQVKRLTRAINVPAIRTNETIHIQRTSGFLYT